MGFLDGAVLEQMRVVGNVAERALAEQKRTNELLETLIGVLIEPVADDE